MFGSEIQAFVYPSPLTTAHLIAQMRLVVRGAWHRLARYMLILHHLVILQNVKRERILSRKKITEVFTPRNSEINQAMYVHRAELEKSLKKDLRKKINLLIFGQSGNGKSWLYKNVLASEEIPYVVANCANVQRNGSIAAEISTAILSGDHVFKTGYKEKKVAKVTAVVAEGGLRT